MQNYSFWCPVITVCALFTDRRTDRWTEGWLTDAGQEQMRKAQLEALSIAKKEQNANFVFHVINTIVK